MAGETCEHGNLKRMCALCDANEEITRLRAELGEAKREVKQWRRIRTPTHGSCCTCQACGEGYEECRCNLDVVAYKLDETQRNLALAESELEEVKSSHGAAIMREDALRQIVGRLAMALIAGGVPREDVERITGADAEKGEG